MGLIRIFQSTQSDLIQHNGKQLEIIRKLTEEEADLKDVGTMYKVQLETGEELDVFHDEVLTIYKIQEM